MREKLTELIYNFHLDTNNHICDGCGSVYAEKVCEEIADHLIANGVTIPVRCKDCIWFDFEDELPDVFRSEQYCYCTEANAYVSINHFCSYGERRTDEQQ